MRHPTKLPTSNNHNKEIYVSLLFVLPSSSFSAKVNSDEVTCCLFQSIAESCICVHSVKKESNVNSKCCAVILPKAKIDKQLPSLWSVCLCACCWTQWMRGDFMAARLLLLGFVSHQSLGVANQCQVNLKPHLGVFFCIPSIYLPQRCDSVRPNKVSCKWLFRGGSYSGDAGSSRLDVQMIKSGVHCGTFTHLLIEVVTINNCGLLPGGTYIGQSDHGVLKRQTSEFMSDCCVLCRGPCSLHKTLRFALHLSV